MKCPKCNHTLLPDSEFCQYCGTCIEKPVTPPVAEKKEPTMVPSAPVVEPPAPEAPKLPTPVEGEVVVTADTEEPTQLPDFGEMTPDEALTAILQMQASNTIEAMEANSKTKPDNEGASDFGLVPEKPIFTIALKSVEGEKEYLDKLYTVSGVKIKYNRRGSTSVNGINGMIDIYETYLPSGQLYKTIYINMYGAKASTKAPQGFVFGNADVPVTKKAPKAKKIKQPKKKYCSRCGSLIDHQSKQCTGCGKKYFKGIRFNKFSVTIIAFLLVIAASAALNVYQYLDNQELQSEIDTLESRNKSAQASINRLNNEKAELRERNQRYSWEHYFFNGHAEIVVDGSNLYHKFGCEDLNIYKGVMIFSAEVAQSQGYVECPYCH